jgi:hypothetical protein
VANRLWYDRWDGVMRRDGENGRGSYCLPPDERINGSSDIKILRVFDGGALLGCGVAVP